MTEKNRRVSSSTWLTSFREINGMDNRYEKLTPEEKEIIERFPTFTAQEIDDVNDMFQHYIFYKKVASKSAAKRGKMLTTSCCHKRNVFYPELQRDMTPAYWGIMHGRHNDPVTCPFCGKRAQLKSAGLKHSGLNEFFNIVFLHCIGGELYAQAYVVRKWFQDMELAPHFLFTAAYHFRIGRAIMIYQGYWKGTPYYSDRDEGKITRRSNVREPFTTSGLYTKNEPYVLVHPEAVEQSTLKYCGYFKYWRNKCFDAPSGDYTFMRFMSVYCNYPTAVEMLLKNGLWKVIDDFVFNGKKNADALKWTEKDPRKAFDLAGDELKQFMGLPEHNIEYVAVYKKLRKRGIKTTFTELYEINKELGHVSLKEFSDVAIKHRSTPKRFFKYLNSFAGPRCHGGGVTFGTVYKHWTDYIEAATAIGYDLTHETVRFPNRLDEAHDNATAEHNRRLREVQEVAQRLREEERRKADEARAKRDPKFAAKLLEDKKRAEAQQMKEIDICKTKDKKYTWESDGFIIRPARCSEEIIAEGNALSHCVGGYAERHMTGKLTICFLRPATAPDSSFITIELDTDGALRQIHGYKNERELGKAIAPEPKKEYAFILEPWLAWIAAGSKRDKQGKPIIKNKNKEANVA